MDYEVIAAGPVIGGEGNLPYRFVMLGWAGPGPGVFEKFSVHRQSFDSSTGRACVSEGHYFHHATDPHSPSAHEKAAKYFAERITRELERYGHHIIPDFRAGRFKYAVTGPAS